VSHAAIMSLAMRAVVRDAEVEDTALVAASRDGDGEAFGELVKRHERRVFRLAARFFRRPEEIEDVAQETFLRAWRKLDTYSSRAPFEHWLTRVCLNCCYGRFRTRRGDELPLEHDVPSAATNPTARLEADRLLARLPDEDRFVLLLLHGEGWSVAEIAERLGWSTANVKVRAHRARKRLRKALEDEIS
jgi:RNA polymerase sigma-70 factor (ECF subfamily)